MKRIAITGGGSAGHVTPNLALVPQLRKTGFDVYYVGRKFGIEKKIVSATDIPYYGIAAGKLRRYFSFHNLIDVFRVFCGFIQSMTLMKKLQPDIVFSKGGFVACPLVWAAWLLGIPVVIHESDITPGLANRLSMPFADRICVSFPETLRVLPSEKAVYTGIPIREALHTGNKAVGKKFCGFTNDKPVVLVIGGSLGAEPINHAVRKGLDRLLETYNICHLCGKGRNDTLLQGKSGYVQFEYVDREMPHLYTMADIVVSRAGATTLFELFELKKPDRGFSQVLNEEDLHKDTLVESINKVYAKRNTLISAMRAAGQTNGIENVLKVIQDCAVLL
jgi:UDP-N-acetylglucosamine--N-acetylmuramyl-(pentapeptide) pyrophosphoryl-undecaprenol N-acetylglucosamine transferase